MLVESSSGIRGLYNKEFLEVAKKYAKVYAEWLGSGKKIVVGVDGRPSGTEIFEAMAGVFCKEGLKVIYAHVSPTPAIEFAVRHLSLDGGVIISGSHNEPDYNGLKFLQRNGAILNPEDAELLIKDSKNARYELGVLEYENKQEEINKAYFDFIVESEKPLDFDIKIVADPNGFAAIPVLKKLQEVIGEKLILVNAEIGKYVRKIEPNAKSLQYLTKILEERSAQVAFGFDGDADRVEIILKDGTIVDGNYVLAMAIDLVLSETKGKKVVVVNDITSNLIYDVAKKYGAKVEEVEVGEINVVNRMEELGSLVGGEGSNGGVIVPPNKCRDGILTMLQILRFCKKRRKTIKEIIDSYPKYYSHRTIMSCKPEYVVKINKALREYFSTKNILIQTRGGETGSTKAYFGDSFLWFRSSKTEFGKYRIITDSPSRKKSKELLQRGIKIFKSIT